MAVGTDVGFPGNVAPLTGNSEFVQRVAATDFLTLTQTATPTGNALNVRTSGAVNIFTVDQNGNVTVVSQTAASIQFKATQAAAATGDAIQILNSSASKVFHVNSGGVVRTMGLGTVAVGAIASNSSTSFSSTGISTDDAVLLFPLKALTTGLGLVQAFAQGTTRIDVFAAGGSAASNTYAVWAVRTTPHAAAI